MIRSENGQLLNYVTLNVRGRDIVGFVDEAQRVVVDKVRLPEGVHLQWSGEFEHQVRAARTLLFVFPIMILLIFVILYCTYHDRADAALMMLAVPKPWPAEPSSCSCFPISWLGTGARRQWTSALLSGSNRTSLSRVGLTGRSVVD